jgi:glycosyltransferase involved in cell wall biosynthesis
MERRPLNAATRGISRDLNNGRCIRVLMLSFLFPPTFAGGTKQALELSKALRAKKVECLFMGANFQNAKAFEIFEGSPVYRLKTASSTRLKYLVYSLKVCCKLFILQKRVDLVFLHSLRPFSLFSVILAKLLRKPVLITLTLIGNDDPESLSRKSFLWRVEAKSLRVADKIICKSSAIKDICLKRGLREQKLVSIPNGVNVEQFKPIADRQEKSAIRKRLGLLESAFVVTFVGRVSPRKGCDILFDAWEALYKKYPQLTLLLLGPYEKSVNAEYDERFEQRLSELVENARERNIKFLGSIPHAQIAQYLRLSDCFVFPSRREGLPNAVLEAMASGLPTICMRIPGITDDIIESGIDGIILDNYDSHELALAIEAIVNDSELAKSLSSNAVRKIRERFSIDFVATKHKELYRSLIDKQS